MDPYLAQYKLVADDTCFDGTRQRFSINAEFNNDAQKQVMHHFQQIATIYDIYGMSSIPTGN